jgi:hypothetical protein
MLSIDISKRLFQRPRLVDVAAPPHNVRAAAATTQRCASANESYESAAKQQSVAWSCNRKATGKPLTLGDPETPTPRAAARTVFKRGGR